MHTADKQIYYGNVVRCKSKYKQVLLPEWKSEHIDAIPPNPLTVTSVNQSNKIQRVHDVNVIHAFDQTSKEWLQLNGSDSKNLVITSLFNEGKPISSSLEHVKESKAEPEQYNFDMVTLLGFEFKLSRHMSLVQERLDWLFSDSKGIFGVVKGQCPCILLDASDFNFAQDLEHLQPALKKLLDDQLMKKSKMLLVSYGSCCNFAWNTSKQVNNFIAKEGSSWIESIRPSGGCNLFQALKLVLKQKDIDSIVLIQRNSPDQNQAAIIDYTVESICGRYLTLLVVSYNCQSIPTEAFLEQLAVKTGGRFHCFRSGEEKTLKSTDLQDLSDELRRCGEMTSQLGELKDGNPVDNKMIVSIKRPSLDLIEADLHQRQDGRLKRLDEEYQALSVESSSPVLERTTKDWLKSYSLKAKGLTLYQLMAPNAYSYVSTYVSSINKPVESKLHHTSMTQMEWHDGSIKNVHIDPVLMFNYQHNLRAALELYQRRLNWLHFESRKCFGTMAQKRVVIIVDMCLATQFQLSEMQFSLKLLLEQQLSNKTIFNLICCGESVEYFKPTMVEASEHNLSLCWKWYNHQNCGGIRKYLPALQFVLENEEERKQNIDVDGIYLVSTGIPEETEEIVCSYVAETTLGKDIAFNCQYFQTMGQSSFITESYQDDVDEAARYLRDLAHQNRGRFHWINSQEIVESDDVNLLKEEINKASNYLNKSQLLLDKLQNRREENEKISEQPKLSGILTPAIKKSKRRVVSVKLERRSPTVWRPNSTHSGNLIPETSNSILGRTQTKPEQLFHEDEKLRHQVFYTEVGNIGRIQYRDNKQSNSSKRVQFCISDVNIPEVEESVTSKDWLYSNSLSKLKLDLNSLICGGECAGNMSLIRRTQHAKFPVVIINGNSYQLHLQPSELENYEKCVEKAMRCYTKRLMWLLAGSRRIFGTIIEKNVVIVVDTSGSMILYISKLKEQMDCLIWEQLFIRKCRFNIIQYSSDVKLWKNQLMEPSKENCKHASDWLRQISCFGETSTLNALQAAFDYHWDVEGIYLLTDGKPNSSTTMVLREAASMNMNRDIKIHTISFNCDDGAANTFLQMLALQSKGRFHKFQSKMDDAENLKNLLLSADSTSPDVLKNSALFESDDVNLIIKEINCARRFLQQSKKFRKQIIPKKLGK